jgi:beta-lactamase regulating signal transducer with metallopeptidase domain
METFIPSNLAEALGWTILHSLWQASIIGAVLMLTLQVVKSTNAIQRYWVSLSALFAVLLIAIITFFTLYQHENQVLALIESDKVALLDFHLIPLQSEKTWHDYFDMLMSLASAYSPQISLLWVLGVLFLSIRFIISLLYIHQLKTYKVKSASIEWEARLRAIVGKIKINRQIKLVESALVAVPTVVGWLKPMILFPLGMFASLPPHEIESILAHELAHIRRNDFIINILQSIVEILFFYHPAVWFISKHIEHERENCCDDIAVAAVGDSLTYIKALTNLATMKTTHLSPALAVTGKNGSLLQRISRIAQNTNLVNHWAKKHTISPKLTAATIVILSLLLLVTKTEATTFLDSLTKSFEKQEKEIQINKLKNNELAFADTTKKLKQTTITLQINDAGKTKEITVTADSVCFGDSVKGKSFFFNTKGDSLGKGYLFGDSMKSIKLKSFKVQPDSLGKVWIHYPNGTDTILIINNLKAFKQFKYLTADSIFTHLKKLKKGFDFQLLNPQNFKENFIRKYDFIDKQVWKNADSIAKTLPKGGRTYVYKYNAMQNPLVIINGESNDLSLKLKDDSPLYIIDGEEIPQDKDAGKEILKKINPNDIVSMEVLKGEKASQKYGEKGKNGVILIKTKKGKKKKSDTSSLGQDKERLYIVDGEEVSKEIADSPEIFKNTLTINVLGKNDAIKIYGERGKNGVTIIHTDRTTSRPKPKDIAKGIKVTELEPLDKNVEVAIYPNPSQQAVNIRFTLEKDEPVWIEVNDMKGQKVATIIDGLYLNKGQNSWLWDTKNIASGSYLLTIKRGKTFSQHKIIVD